MQAVDRTVSVAVKDPVLEENGSFTSYLIAGEDKLGSFEIRRRFNDFYVMREGLIKKFPGCYIPPMPEKKVIGNKDEKLVEDRKRFLDYFCKKVAGAPYLYYSDTFQLLVRNKGADLDKLIDAQPPPTTTSLIQLYRELCPKQFPKERTSEARAKSNTFGAYLKRAEKELKLLRDDVRQIAEAKRNFNDNLNVCNTIMLPEYEKNVFSEYVNHQPEFLLFNSNPEISEKVKELKEITLVDSFDYIVDLISVELREVIALQEAIQSRQNIEESMRKLMQKRKDDQAEVSKLVSGKTTFKSIFTKGSKQQQKKVYERAIEDDQKQIDNLNILNDLVAIYQGQVELPAFKVYKQKQYYQIINLVAKTEVRHLNVYGGLLKGILAANQSMNFQ